MLDFLLQYDLTTHFQAFLLGSTRLMVFAAVAPFMGNQVLNMTVRSAVVMALYLVVHPTVVSTMPVFSPLSPGALALLGGLLLKEIFLGFVLGWTAGLVFWAVESAGLFIDNQRGAAQAVGADPLTGDQTSPTGSFLFQSVAVLFFASGAFLAMLGVVYSTYEWWPVAEALPMEFFRNTAAALHFGESVARLAASALLISAPVVLACLFTDIALGLINRFASQLNVYILSLPIKCALASFLLIFYFAVLMSDAPERFALFGIDVSALRAMMP